jgi:hypothetical protein
VKSDLERKHLVLLLLGQLHCAPLQHDHPHRLPIGPLLKVEKEVAAEDKPALLKTPEGPRNEYGKC